MFQKLNQCDAYILNINVVKRVRLVAVLYQEEEVISQKLSNYCFLKTLVK